MTGSPFPPPGAGEPFWFLGGQARILVPGTATNQAISVPELDDPKGQAPPSHVHDGENEAWNVLDGEISFFVGDTRRDLQGGQVAHGTRGVPHSYLVRPPRSRMTVVYAPADIDEWFRANGTPVAYVPRRRPRTDRGPGTNVACPRRGR